MSEIPYKQNEIERYILDTLREIKYGSVEVTIHKGQIVQIEKSEKQRFDSLKTTT